MTKKKSTKKRRPIPSNVTRGVGRNKLSTPQERQAQRESKAGQKGHRVK